MKFGIIGYGSFGAFAAGQLGAFAKVLVYDARKEIPESIKADLEEVCSADYLMLAIPLSAYDNVLALIKPKLAKSTIILDIASVKLEPIRLIKEKLPDQPFVATHPLFGPESAGDSLRGQTVIFCESNISPPELSSLKSLLLVAGLNIKEMTADEHDKQMSVVQGLTFFISRALNRYGLHDMKLETPSFQRLLHLAQLDNAHTDELMDTILTGNKYALAARRKFMADIEALDAEINHRDN